MAFRYCSRLAYITIPDSVTSIGDYAFYDCWNLGSVTIPDSVTTIGAHAFAGCESLRSINGAKPALLSAENIRNTPYGEKMGICSHCGAKLKIFGGCPRCRQPKKYK